MKDSPYFRQAELLLRILPLIYTENNFAVKGGTAINFFVREVPRLSVDIDLVYLPINSRKEALYDIENSLRRIINLIQRVIPGTYCSKKLSGGKLNGLFVGREDAVVKIEVNTVIRGC